MSTSPASARPIRMRSSRRTGSRKCQRSASPTPSKAATAQAAGRALGRGGWRRAVAVVHPAPVGAAHGGGAVWVEGDGPAPGVDRDQMMEGAEQDQIGELGAAAAAAGRDVVDLASGRRLGA